MRAILTVYDKTGLVEFAQGLSELGVELYSTGGTEAALAEAGLAVRSLAELTGFPEILDGRVKSLHPAVHGGILARRDDPGHLRELEAHGIGPIDLVAVNLYPFVETVRRPDASLQQALENIDIGGVALLRAAAKNFPDVLVVVDPRDYREVLAALREGQVPLPQRRRLAYKAFQHVALYDTAVAEYLREADELFPETLTFGLRKRLDLRYGENPHQRGAFYEEQTVAPGDGRGIAGAEQLHGIELSYVNIIDADAAWRAACDFAEPTVVVVKHASPCGLASHPDLAEAYRRAFAGDPVSAYGGIVAANRPFNEEMAAAMKGVLYHVVIAPDYEPAALERLEKRRDLRILRVPLREAAPASAMDYRRVSGGILIQEEDHYPDNKLELRAVTKRGPTSDELEDLRFAWRAVKHVKSNAIVLARDRALVGVGAGQPNRVTSVHLALRAAGEKAAGSALASDAFFPFPDGVELAGDSGVRAIIQPGGSIRDEECIAAADARDMAMVFTGVRHFRH